MNKFTLSTKHLSELDFKARRNSMFLLHNELVVLDNKYLHSRIRLEYGCEVDNGSKEKIENRASCLLEKEYIITHGGKKKDETSNKLEIYKYDNENQSLHKLFKCKYDFKLSDHICSEIGKKYIVFYGGINEKDEMNDELFFFNKKELIRMAESNHKKNKYEAVEEIALEKEFLPRPLPRLYSTLTYHKDEHTCILYGGKYNISDDDDDNESNLVLNDLWVLSLDDNKDACTYSWYQPTLICGHVPFRANHNCVAIKSNTFLVFGGVDENEEIMNDFFIMETKFEMDYDDEMNYKFEFMWSSPIMNSSPMPLKDASVCYDKKNKSLYIFGGKNNMGNSKDLYEIKIDNENLFDNSYIQVDNHKELKDYLKKLDLEFCLPLFIDQNITVEDISHFTIDDFRTHNINETIASTLLGKKIIKSFKGIIDGDETDAILVMIKEHYDPNRIQLAINTIHEANMTIDKDSLYRELNNDNFSHPQKLRELRAVLDGCDDKKDREREKEEIKRKNIEEMNSKKEADCNICYDKHATHMYSGCGHLCICEDCSGDYQNKCVQCNAPGIPIKVNFPNPPN